VAKLVFKYGNQSREISLEKASFTCGRGADNDLCLQDNLLSRQHLAIRSENGQFVAHDMGSTNGTFVNDQRVTRKVLNNGDIVRIGDATFLFVADPSPSKTPTSRNIEKEQTDEVTPITRMAATRDIVRHIDEIAEPLSLQIDAESLRTSSLDQISRSIAVEKGRKETAMFFILYQVCKAVSSVVTLDEILKTAIKLAFDVINAERGAIVLSDPKTRAMRVGITYHRKHGVMAADSIPISQTIVQRVIDERVALIAHDTLTDPGFRDAVSIVNLSIRSALCVPLWEADKVYGAIYMDNRAASYAFTQPDLELLTAIANLVAIRLRQESLNEALRREEVLRAELQKYFSPDVAELIIKGGEGLNTDLASRNVTVSFIDIENSTTIAERMGPGRIAAILDWFYETASNAIFEHKGNINNFIGDAVMGIYNAPLELPDHALAAVKSAVKLLKEIRKHNIDKPDEAFNIRVGINTGTVMAGDVGTIKRHFTALGDAVNVAERLTRFPEVNRIIVGPDTYKAVKSIYECRELGDFRLKGKTSDIKAYEVVVAS
jgi:adenylate cyclase